MSRQALAEGLKGNSGNNIVSTSYCAVSKQLIKLGVTSGSRLWCLSTRKSRCDENRENLIYHFGNYFDERRERTTEGTGATGSSGGTGGGVTDSSLTDNRGKYKYVEEFELNDGNNTQVGIENIIRSSNTLVEEASPVICSTSVSHTLLHCKRNYKTIPENGFIS